MAKNPIDAINPFPNQEGDTRETVSAEEPMNSGGPRACLLGENQIIGLPPSVKRPTKSALDRHLASPSARARLFPVFAPDNASTGGGQTVAAPKTAGAPEPGPDTSRSPVANRDVAGPRKAGTTPRPTAKPIL